MIKVFISYSAEDTYKKDILKKKFEENNQTTPLVVEDFKQPAKDLSEKIKEFMKKSDVFVVLLTEKSMYNQWVNQEIGFAFSHYLSGKKSKIIPVVEKRILHKLKGFIHSNIDLSFAFSRNNFRNICDDVVEYIENNYGSGQVIYSFGKRRRNSGY